MAGSMRLQMVLISPSAARLLLRACSKSLAEKVTSSAGGAAGVSTSGAGAEAGGALRAWLAALCSKISCGSAIGGSGKGRLAALSASSRRTGWPLITRISLMP